MLTTVIFLLVIIGIIVGNLFLTVVFFSKGLSWVNAENLSIPKSIATLLLITFFNFLDFGLRILLKVPVLDSFVWQMLIDVLVGAAIACLVINRRHKITALRSLQTWMLTWVPCLVFLLGYAFVVKPCVFEMFTMPTNSMAPTILGQHIVSTCPECSEFCYGSSPSRTRPIYRCICSNFHVNEIKILNIKFSQQDRFVVSKYIKPKRWDLLVFYHPEQPDICYLKRLVGLPGETIHIEDGAVWVNGKKVEVPEHLEGIQYESEPPTWADVKLWGTKENPATLSEGEYFVLGDFSIQSNDSRWWKKGAPGHNPFAVPKNYISGVVTHTYWPPSRWRIHR